MAAMFGEERSVELVTNLPAEADHRLGAWHETRPNQGQTPTGHTKDEIRQYKGLSEVLEEVKVN